MKLIRLMLETSAPPAVNSQDEVGQQLVYSLLGFVKNDPKDPISQKIVGGLFELFKLSAQENFLRSGDWIRLESPAVLPLLELVAPSLPAHKASSYIYPILQKIFTLDDRSSRFESSATSPVPIDPAKVRELERLVEICRSIIPKFYEDAAKANMAFVGSMSHSSLVKSANVDPHGFLEDHVYNQFNPASRVSEARKRLMNEVVRIINASSGREPVPLPFEEPRRGPSSQVPVAPPALGSISA